MVSYARPEDQSDMGLRVISMLDQSGILYDIIEIDPDFADTADFCREYGYSSDSSGNTIIVASKKEPVKYAACLVKASDRLDVNTTVRKLMGVRRLSFASREQTVTLTGMEIGGVTPLALPNGLPIYVDEKILELDYVILGSGVRSSKIKVAPEILRQVQNAYILPGISIGPSL